MTTFEKYILTCENIDTKYKIHIEPIKHILRRLKYLYKQGDPQYYEQNARNERYYWREWLKEFKYYKLNWKNKNYIKKTIKTNKTFRNIFYESIFSKLKLNF